MAVALKQYAWMNQGHIALLGDLAIVSPAGDAGRHPKSGNADGSKRGAIQRSCTVSGQTGDTSSEAAVHASRA